MPRAPLQSDLPALRTSRFALHRRLGAGGFGTVYEAFDHRRNALVALKVLHAAAPEHIARFKQEFRTVSELSHPNLISLYELASDGAVWFFSMELLSGRDFLSHVRGAHAIGHSSDSQRDACSPTLGMEADAAANTNTPMARAPTLLEGPDAAQGRSRDLNLPIEAPLPGAEAAALSVDRLVRGLIDLSQALLALHQAGQLHRDIKPGNVLCTDAGRVVLLDFGLALDLGERTSTLNVAGTPDYMSPEQAQGLPLSPASDWYSVGVMIYEALTGRVPFAGTVMQVLRQKIEQEAPPPTPLPVGVPEALPALCRRLLARRPEDRPGGDEVLALLRAVPLAEALGERTLAPARRSAPFVGRAAQRAALQDAYEESQRGRTIVALCHGGSGSGKSALCRRFLRDLAEQELDALVLSGRCYEHEDVPFKTLDGIVDALGGALRRRLRAQVAALLPRNVAALARLFPALLQVPEVRAAPARRIVDDELARQAAFAALRELLLRLSDRGPLVLCIDDLQWGDADGTALLLQLLRPPEPPPLLLIVAYRSEEVGASAALQLLHEGLRGPGAAALAVHEVSVPELPAAEATELALRLLPAPDPARAAAIAAEARGNPFFVSELSRFLTADVEPAAASLASAGATVASLDRLLRDRACRLPPEPRRLLHVVAIAGQPLARAVAARAAFGDEGGDEPGAVALLRRERLVRARGDGAQGEALLPYHDRVREAVVAGLGEEEARALHLCLGSALEAAPATEPEWLVYHFQRGGDGPRVARYALAASAAAQAALAYHQAARLCQVALESGALSAADELSCRARLADALAAAGRPREAGAAYLALAAREDPAGALQRRRQAARQLMAGGYPDEGFAVLRQLLAAARLPLSPRPLRIAVSILLHMLLLRLRGRARFRERAEAEVAPLALLRIDTCEAVSSIAATDPMLSGYFLVLGLWLALRTGEPRRLAHALSGEAHMRAGMGQPLPRVLPALRLAQQLAARLDDRYALGRVHFVEGHAAHLDGRWRESSQALARAEEILREGCPEAAPQLELSAALRMYNLRYRGDLGALAAQVPPLLREAVEQGRLSQEAIVRLIAGFLLPLREDDADAAEAEVREAERRFSGQPFNLQHVFALDARLMILLYRGRGADAWELLRGSERALRDSGQLGIDFFARMFQNLRGQLALAVGQTRVAAAAARALARGHGRYCAPMAALLRGLLQVRAGRPGAALPLLLAAEEGFAAAEMTLHAACARLRRGEVVGGERGARLQEEARAALAALGVRSPARMAAMLAPRAG